VRNLEGKRRTLNAQHLQVKRKQRCHPEIAAATEGPHISRRVHGDRA
jgi:hypothetical protein